MIIWEKKLPQIKSAQLLKRRVALLIVDQSQHSTRGANFKTWHLTTDNIIVCIIFSSTYFILGAINWVAKAECRQSVWKRSCQWRWSDAFSGQLISRRCWNWCWEFYFLLHNIQGWHMESVSCMCFTRKCKRRDASCILFVQLQYVHMHQQAVGRRGHARV